MPGAECRLLNILEVILGVSVQNQLANLDSRVIRVRPHLGHIEDVPFILEAVLLGHHLNLKRPGGSVPLSDVVEEVPCCVVGVL